MSAAAATRAVPGWRATMLRNIDLLDEGECLTVRGEVEALREQWVRRHERLPFFTLGASNYFDIAYNPELPYYRMAARLNPVLRERLGWLYERLAERLGEALGIPVEYPPPLALPGFHIFHAHPEFGEFGALMHRAWFESRADPAVVASPIHCDTPQHVVDWSGVGEPDLRYPVSFTLAVALPADGAGMRVWDVRIEQTAHLPESLAGGFLARRTPRLHRYRVGAFALHSGLFYHQVDSMRDMRPDDVRITLQGHGVPCRGAMQLYW